MQDNHNSNSAGPAFLFGILVGAAIGALSAAPRSREWINKKSEWVKSDGKEALERVRGHAKEGLSAFKTHAKEGATAMKDHTKEGTSVMKEHAKEGVSAIKESAKAVKEDVSSLKSHPRDTFTQSNE
jgi:gas vesicle protein